MAKIVLNDVTNINSLSVINDNFDKIEQELQNKVLYRDNTSLEDNTVKQDIDLNGKRIINLGGILPGTSSFPGKYLGPYTSDPVGIALSEGMLYFRTGSPFQALMVFTSSGWVEASPTDVVNTDTIDPSLFATSAEVAEGEILGKVISPLSLREGVLNKTSTFTNTIANLRNLDKNLNKEVSVLGYYSAGDGGGGKFWLDPFDTTSTDNGGNIIVAVDGGRWKRLLFSGEALTSKMFGMVAGGGDASASLNASALASLKTVAQSMAAKVVFDTGIYTLPPEQEMKANGTTWFFAKGAVLKLQSTQSINQDFLLWTRPVNQKVFGLQFDANRAVQNEVLFGADRCGAIVISPTDCEFDGVHVVSSPGKGFAVVSAAGETSARTHIRNVTGGDCKTQAVIFDANNSTGFFDDCSIDGVNIGTTSHAGLAINDGVTDCTISNVLCNVGLASVWDAVSVRDSSRLRLVNITGKGGRNGVYFHTQNTECGDLDLENIRGESSNGVGVSFVAVKRVNGVNIRGLNNADTGVNLGRIVSGDNRCEDVHLTNVVGSDNRGVPAQLHGIYLAGTRRCSVSAPTASGNVTANLTMIAGVNESSFIEWEQQYSQVTPSIAAGANADVDVTLNAPFPIEYLAVKALPPINSGTSSLALVAAQEVAFTAGTYRLKVVNQSGTTAHTGTITLTIGTKR